MTQIMGILNVTPDSFIDGGNYDTVEKALNRAIRMCEQGATIIDIGGESTRPGAKPISMQEEVDRVFPVIEDLAKIRLNGTKISLDTYKPEVAKWCAPYIDILNDVTGENTYEVAKQYRLEYIAMDMPGNPQTMSSHKNQRSTDQIMESLTFKAKQAKSDGVSMYLDPGFGFGKTPEQNYALLERLPELRKFAPVVAGISHKRFRGYHEDLGIIDNYKDTIRQIGFDGLDVVLRVHDVLQTEGLLATGMFTRMDYDKKG